LLFSFTQREKHEEHSNCTTQEHPNHHKQDHTHHPFQSQEHFIPNYICDTMARNEDDGFDFEDARDSNSVPLSSLAIALASATANERDRRQRKTLVERLTRLLFDVLGHPRVANASENHPPKESEGGALSPENNTVETIPPPTETPLATDASLMQTDDTKESINQKSTHAVDDAVPLSNDRTALMEQILGEDEGSTTIACSFLSANPTKKTTWNRNRPLALHWVWQTSHDRDGSIQHSTCNLSVLVKEGVTIEFWAPPSTPLGAESQQETHQEKQQRQPDSQKIAICEISRFQWTLEGATKKASDDGESFEDIDIESFWKLENATLSWTMGSVGDFPAEEVLLEGRDISLMGRIVDNFGTKEENGKTKDTQSSLRLQSKSVLSLKVSSVGSLGGSDEEKRRVGLALRTLVAFLDQIISVPNLKLYLTDLSGGDNNENGAPSGSAEVDTIPSFEDAGDSMNLGDAMRYYLKYYCSGTNTKTVTSTTASNRPSKFLSMGDSVATFGALAATGTSFITPIGGLVSVAALAAKDGVTAAARKGKEVRMSHMQQQSTSLEGEGGNELTNRTSLESAAAAASKFEPSAEDGYKFGDVGRGLFGSIREMRQRNHSDGGNSGNYLKENKGRFVGVAGGTAGAAIGLVIAGPVGAIAGSFFGSKGSQIAVQKQEQQQQQESGSTDGEHNSNDSNGGHRFGDNIRKFSLGVVARGKEASGRETSEGYKFGDFSRGLFAKRSNDSEPA
jgi:hypothetical protein